MLQKLFPKRYTESVYGFDFEAAWKAGYRGILFDIDNTLVPHDAPATTKSDAFLLRLKDMGFKLTIISNNAEPRVKSFTMEAGVPYIYKAHKPSAEGYLRAAEHMGLPKSQLLFFGDQIFTDILGANNAGIESILVKPIDKSTDILKIRVKRWLEAPLLRIYFARQGKRGK